MCERAALPVSACGLLILPDTRHFAFIQDPQECNQANLDFIDYK